MLLSDIFSIPFLICLAICILLIGCSSIYFYQRIVQQDHKIASMVSLISSMTEEIAAPVTCGIPQRIVQQDALPVNGGSRLIAVSDDEDDDEDDDSTSDSTSESDGESLADADTDSEYSETSSENEIGDEHILSAVDFNELQSDLENAQIAQEEIVEEHTFDELVEDDNTKSIHLDEPAGSITDFSMFKSINITDSASQPEETSYRKMSLQKLREIAQQNGHIDVAKLKKMELVKLLEGE